MSPTIKFLIENSIMLLIFCVVFDFCWAKYREYKTIKYQILTGLLIGALSVCLMMWDTNAFKLIKIDCRTVLLCLSGLFFGLIPTAIALVITLITRWIAIESTFTILVLESFYTFFAAFLGVIFNWTVPQWFKKNWHKTLLYLSYITHGVMFVAIILFSDDKLTEVKTDSWWICFLWLPAITIILGRMMIEEIKNWNTKESLKLSDERFNKVSICSDDIFWEINTRAKITYVSKTVTEIIGYSPEEIIGHTPQEIIEDQDSINSLVQYARNGDIINTPFSRVLIFTHKNGSKVICQARGLKRIDALGNVEAYMGVIHDITQIRLQQEQMIASQRVIIEQNHKYLKLNQELEQTNKKIIDINLKLTEANQKAEKADRAKLEFISHISHEIKNPLIQINNCIDATINSSISTDEKKKLLLQAKENSHYIIMLANDIMDSDRIQAGAVKLKLEIVNLEDLFTEIYDYYYSQNLYIYKKPIILSKNIELGNGEQIVKIDLLRLKQIINNLINNAFKFTYTVKIEFACKRYNEDMLLFSVSDTGVGIPEDSYDNIFSPYNHREQPFMKQTLLENTGLGLYICRELILRMGGNIWFNSKIGKGTTFYFSLPFIHVTDVTIKNTINYDWHDKVALIIGEDKYNMILASEIISKTKIKTKSMYVHDVVENGLATTEYFEWFDLIIIDKELSNLKKIQRFLQNYPQTPVLILDPTIDLTEIYTLMKEKLG